MLCIKKCLFVFFTVSLIFFIKPVLAENQSSHDTPWKHLGFGLAADVFNLNIEADGEDYPGIDFKGDLEFKYTGRYD
jgi:hypothetical protein